MNAPIKSSRLLEMIRDGNVDSLRTYLEQDPSTANIVIDGAPLLHHACFPPNEAIVAILLQSGSSVNEVDEDGDTSLHIVSYGESVKLMDLILNAGAKIDAPNGDGVTPLMVAAKDGGDGVEKLLNAGASVAILDNFGRSALHWSVTGSHDNAHIVRLLLVKGSDPLQKNVMGDTPADYARAMKKEAILNELEAERPLT